MESADPVPGPVERAAEGYGFIYDFLFPMKLSASSLTYSVTWEKLLPICKLLSIWVSHSIWAAPCPGCSQSKDS